MKIGEHEIEKISELDEVTFVKEIPSDTKTVAVHVKIRNQSYQVACAPIPRLYTETIAYNATRMGRVTNFDNPIIRFKGNDIVEGVKELVAKLNGNPTHDFEKPPRVF
jgi:hypothetical protein